MRSHVGFAAALSVALLGACSGRRAPEVLRLTSFRQGGEAGVFLNETLVLHFDQELQRASVTPASLIVTDDEGRRAEGRIDVQKTKILFSPDLPRREDLSDAGLLPGTRYEVWLAGFPNPDGIRSREGHPLLRTLVASFETVDRSPADGEELRRLFVDDTPDRAAPLQLLASELGPVDPIVMLCDEPIDPRTLEATDFGLLRVGEEGRESIPVRAGLRDNTRSGARIELRPLDGAGNLRGLEVGTYQLLAFPEAIRLCDLGGHTVIPAWGDKPLPLTVDRVERSSGGGAYVEEFLDRRRRSPASVEGSAGTAAWEDGFVTVRLPAACGDGSDGPVVMGASEERPRIQATQLLLPAGTETALSAAGLIVIQAQGRMAIDGTLARDVEGGVAESQSLGHATHSDWHRWIHAPDRGPWQVPGMGFAPGETLSRWLERAREDDERWTVLIAGGDLVVSGVIWTDGPLLLVAGGWIRVTGDVRTRPGEYWSLGDVGSSLSNSPRASELRLDAPLLNPLLEAQTWSVLSGPIRPLASRVAWRPAVVRADARQGRVQVRYLGERYLEGGGIEELGPVDSPVLLEDCEVLRLRIDLTIPAADEMPRFRPPVVDAVELSWDSSEVDG